MNFNYSQGHGPHDRSRFVGFPFGSPLKIDSPSKALLVSQALAAIVKEPTTQRTSVPTETFHRMWLLVRRGTELIAGLFTVFYLIAAFALAGALLFFTFAH